MHNAPLCLLALDMDGTITQHKTPLEKTHREALNALKTQYRLLMVGAGQCGRIFRQMGEYPIDIVGNYGMQACEYDPVSKTLLTVRDDSVPCDRDAVEKRISDLRYRFGYLAYAGDSVEYHSSGCVTFPLLGVKATKTDKLAFDPDRRKRRKIYAEVVAAFPEYHVFVGGSSSFDMAPHPYDKRYALDEYCARHGISKENVTYVGDDYGMGGNDEAVFHSDYRFVTIDDYREFPRVAAMLLSQSAFKGAAM